MDYISLTVTGLIFESLITVIGCTAVGIRSKTTEIKNNKNIVYLGTLEQFETDYFGTNWCKYIYY